MAEDPIDSSNFSKAFDELQEARKAVEKYGTARLANPPAPEVLAAQKAFNEATRRYDEVVGALVKPAID